MTAISNFLSIIVQNELSIIEGIFCQFYINQLHYKNKNQINNSIIENYAKYTE